MVDVFRRNVDLVFAIFPSTCAFVFVLQKHGLGMRKVVLSSSVHGPKGCIISRQRFRKGSDTRVEPRYPRAKSSFSFLLREFDVDPKTTAKTCLGRCNCDHAHVEKDV